MDELENKNFENEFLNILEEPESTLVFGTDEKGSDGCDTDGGCKAQCKSDACTKDCSSNTPVCGTDGCTPAKGDSKSGDDPGAIYYYWATGRWLKYGYYVSGNPYTLLKAGAYFTNNGVSAANSTTSAILISIKNNTLGLNNMYISNKTYGNFSTTGTNTTIIGTTATTPALIGYIKMRLSANTHTTSATISVPVYAKSYSANNSVFTSQYNQSKTTSVITGASISLPEKTFTIYTKYANTPIAGSEISITNVTTIFPQYFGYDQKFALRTGNDGFICLCTSSTTSNTITGTIKRKGFNGYVSQSFTATAFSPTTVTLGTPQNSDKETIIFGKVQRIHPSLATYASDKFLNWTHNIGTGHTSITGEVPTASNANAVLTFDKVYQLRPGYSYYVNDPIMGKGERQTYVATQRVLTTTAQQFGTIQIYGNHVTSLTLPPCSGSSSLSSEATDEIIGSVTTGGTTHTGVVGTYAVSANQTTDSEVVYFGVSRFFDSYTILANYLYTITLSARVTSSTHNSKVLLKSGTFSYTRGSDYGPDPPPIE